MTEVKFLLDTLSASALEKSRAIVDSYPKEANAVWTWAPNAADFDPLLPPSGFSFAVNADSKVVPDVFSPRKMFYGTAAFEIPADLLQPQDVIKRKDEIKEALRNKIVSEAVREPSIHNYSTKTYRDASTWDMALGGRGGYAGVFVSEKRGNDEYVKTVWIVVRAGVPNASEELYEKLERASGVRSWREILLEDPETQRVFDFAKRNRERLLGFLAHELLPNQLDEQVDLQSKMQNEVTLKPTIETLSHTVEFDNRTSTPRAIYYNNTIDASALYHTGYIFNETPRLGPIVITQNMVNYVNYVPSFNEFFPTSTGRQETLTADPVPLDSAVSDTFVWDAPHSTNKRLERRIFRIRNEVFKAIEAKMGYDHTAEELALKPLIVKVCDA